MELKEKFEQAAADSKNLASNQVTKPCYNFIPFINKEV